MIKERIQQIVEDPLFPQMTGLVLGSVIGVMVALAISDKAEQYEALLIAEELLEVDNGETQD
jgi:hypothetical protein